MHHRDRLTVDFDLDPVETAIELEAIELGVAVRPPARDTYRAVVAVEHQHRWFAHVSTIPPPVKESHDPRTGNRTTRPRH